MRTYNRVHNLSTYLNEHEYIWLCSIVFTYLQFFDGLFCNKMCTRVIMPKTGSGISQRGPKNQANT